MCAWIKTAKSTDLWSKRLQNGESKIRKNNWVLERGTQKLSTIEYRKPSINWFFSSPAALCFHSFSFLSLSPQSPASICLSSYRAHFALTSSKKVQLFIRSAFRRAAQSVERVQKIFLEQFAQKAALVATIVQKMPQIFIAFLLFYVLLFLLFLLLFSFIVAFCFPAPAQSWKAISHSIGIHLHHKRDQMNLM